MVIGCRGSYEWQRSTGPGVKRWGLFRCLLAMRTLVSLPVLWSSVSFSVKQNGYARASQRFQWSWLSQRVTIGEWHLDNCWCLHLSLSPACLFFLSGKAFALGKCFFEFISRAAYCGFLSPRNLIARALMKIRDRETDTQYGAQEERWVVWGE